MEKLKNSTVAIVGLGGVGGSAAEAICRMGVGRLILIDNDDVDDTNRNRQLFATAETVGMDKVDAAAMRLRAINPDAELILKKEFYLPENSDFLFDLQPDLILDAIDTVTSKLHIAKTCKENDIPLVCCLGTGNRVDPSQLRWGDISQTAGCGCPLARVMRRELKKRDVLKQTVIYSVEEPHKAIVGESDHGRHAPASCAFVPPAAGCLLASAGIRLLLEKHNLTL
jgi:tRNA A37 threonylcarbamoyladenosine dehydratase